MYRGVKLALTEKPLPRRRCTRIPGTARSFGSLANALSRACTATNVFGSVYFPTSISVPLKKPEISPLLASSVYRSADVTFTYAAPSERAAALHDEILAQHEAQRVDLLLLRRELRAGAGDPGSSTTARERRSLELQQ